MTSWTVEADSNDFVSGCPLHFIEEMQNEDEDYAELTVGDKLTLIKPNGEGTGGIVIEISKEKTAIQVNGQKYNIRPANEEDEVIQIETELKVTTWVII